MTRRQQSVVMVWAGVIALVIVLLILILFPALWLQ